jgi:RNA polymerase sigma-70 factor (ECF subfamily)
MMFSCCHPRLPEEAQVALILNILCGFGADEIVSAFPPAARQSSASREARRFSRRPPTVRSLGRRVHIASIGGGRYLLFNEGYHGGSPESAVRIEPALRRCASTLLREVSAAAPDGCARPLMCLHAARFPARPDPAVI